MLELRDVSKRYDAVNALFGATLSVAAGTVHCVLGENGAGKSTLCNVVSGSVRATGGSMLLKGAPYAPKSPADALGRGVAMVHQHFSLVPTLTVGENLLLRGGGFRLRRAALAERLDRLDATYGLRVDVDALAGELPVGARQRVEIVKALLPDPDLVILDEPTGVLDGAEVDALIAVCRAIAESGRAVVLVTHKLGEVARVADTTTVLRGGTVVGGGSLPVSELLPLMLGKTPTVDRGVPATTIGAPVLRVQGVTLTRSDGSRALDGVDLDVRQGEIVGIAGVEGNGQSELVRVLSGALRPDSGTVTLDRLGVVPEDRHHEGMVGEMSVAENLFLADLGRFRRHGLLRRSAMDDAAAEVIREFGIRAAGPRAPMRSLSGGNQQKVVLARELAVDGLRVLVAAQPTRGLDAGAVTAVLARLREAAARGVAVLVVSSEVSELLTLCDRIAVAYRGRLLGPVDTTAPDAATTVGALMTGAAA